MDIFQPSTTPEPTSPEGQEVEGAELESQQPEESQEQLEGQETHEGNEETDQNDDEQSPPEDGQDELILGKFKSVEDMAKAYRNLEKQFTKNRMQQKPEPQAQQQTGQLEDPNEVFWNAFQNDPLGTIQYLAGHVVQQQTAPIIEQRQTERVLQDLDKLSQEYQQVATPDGLQQWKQKMIEIAEEDFGNPSLADNPSPRLMKLAAQELWGDSKAALYQKAKQKGREEAEQARRAKQGLSAPSGAKPKETPKSAEEQIADSIVNAGRRGGIFGR